MRGRPEHYRDPRVVREYDRRYAAGVARWKHDRKCRTLESWIAPAATVLEVACGPGRYHAALSTRPLVEVDRSPEMLRELLRRNPRARVIVADAAALPFDDRAFDSVVSLRFISHLRGSYRAQVLTELARVARRDVIIDGRHLYNLRTLSRWVRARLGLARAEKLRHSLREFREEFACAGLRLAGVRSVFWGLSARVMLRATKDNVTSPARSGLVRRP